jgi:hypothetical protein
VVLLVAAAAGLAACGGSRSLHVAQHADEPELASVAGGFVAPDEARELPAAGGH